MSRARELARLTTHPIPNSSQLAFPTIGAPASRRSLTAVASYGGLKSESMAEEHVVGMSAVHMLSLTATKTSCSGKLCGVGGTLSG